MLSVQPQQQTKSLKEIVRQPIRIDWSSSRDKGQTKAIQTVPFAGWLWSVIEDMTQMAAAPTAMDLGPDLKDELSIFFRPDRVRQSFQRNSASRCRCRTLRLRHRQGGRILDTGYVPARVSSFKGLV